jgi:TM2 domain-containing membrane protein YozV
MKKSTKAALLSMFVLPGLGHIYLKKYLRGAVILFVVVSGLTYIIWSATVTALHYLEGAADKAQGGAMSMREISDLAGQAAASNPDPLSAAAVYIVIIVWIAAVMDAYRTGRKMEGRDPDDLNRKN